MGICGPSATFGKFHLTQHTDKHGMFAHAYSWIHTHEITTMTRFCNEIFKQHSNCTEFKSVSNLPCKLCEAWNNCVSTLCSLAIHSSKCCHSSNTNAAVQDICENIHTHIHTRTHTHTHTHSLHKMGGHHVPAGENHICSTSERIHKPHLGRPAWHASGHDTTFDRPKKGTFYRRPESYKPE